MEIIPIEQPLTVNAHVLSSLLSLVSCCAIASFFIISFKLNPSLLKFSSPSSSPSSPPLPFPPLPHSITTIATFASTSTSSSSFHVRRGKSKHKHEHDDDAARMHNSYATRAAIQLFCKFSVGLAFDPQTTVQLGPHKQSLRWQVVNIRRRCRRRRVCAPELVPNFVFVFVFAHLYLQLYCFYLTSPDQLLLPLPPN